MVSEDFKMKIGNRGTNYNFQCKKQDRMKVDDDASSHRLSLLLSHCSPSSCTCTIILNRLQFILTWEGEMEVGYTCNPGHHLQGSEKRFMLSCMQRIELDMIEGQVANCLLHLTSIHRHCFPATLFSNKCCWTWNGSNQCSFLLLF